MKTVRKLLGVLLAVLLISALALNPVTASAADAYEPVAGTTTDFTKYLVVSNDANIPAATFSFTVEPGAAVAAGEGTLAVLAGLDADKVVIEDTTFTAGQDTTAGAAEDGIVNTTEKKYAQNTVTVDLTQVRFPEPGVYRYIITESASDDPFVNDATATRTLDVYVGDDNGALAIEGYVMYSGTLTTGPSADAATADGKSAKFVNEVETANLTFSKTVEGNQGARDKFFLFTLTIENAGAGTIVNVTVDGTTPTKTAATIYEAAVMTGEDGNGVTTLTADAEGKIVHNFYLSHGDSVTVTGVPKTATYALTEVKEDYENTPPTNASGSFADGNATVAFTNTREGVIPTGVAMTLVPGAAILLIAAAALVILNRKKSKA